MRYVGGFAKQDLTLDEVSRLPVSSYEFLPRSGGDVARSVALNQDTDAGTFALLKAVGIGAGIATASLPVAGIGMLLSTVGSDLYSLYHAHKQGNNSFWNEYFENLKEVQVPDPGWRDMVEGLNAGSSFAQGGANALPLSRSGYYTAGQLGGRLALDTAAFLAGGAKWGTMALPVNMGIVEGINTYTKDLAMTDTMKAPLWPALAAGLSVGVTGMLFMRALPTVLQDVVPHYTGAGLNSSWGSLARQTLPEVAAGAGRGALEFGAWGITEQVMHGVLQGELPDIHASEVATSMALGAVLGGAVRSMGVVGHWRKLREAEKPVVTETGTVVEKPKEISEELPKMTEAVATEMPSAAREIGADIAGRLDPIRTTGFMGERYVERPTLKETPLSEYQVPTERTTAWAKEPLAPEEIATYEKMSIDQKARPHQTRLSMEEAAYIADQATKRFRSLEANAAKVLRDAQLRGETADVSAMTQPLEDIVRKQLFRYGGKTAPEMANEPVRFRPYQVERERIPDVPGKSYVVYPIEEGVARQGGGRYYNDENLRTINKFIYKQLPDSKPIGGIEEYYGFKKAELYPAETVIEKSGKDMVSARKRSAWEYYSEYEKGLGKYERDYYDKMLVEAADEGKYGYAAKAYAKKKTDARMEEQALGQAAREKTKTGKEQEAAEKYRLFDRTGLEQGTIGSILGDKGEVLPEFYQGVIKEAAERRGIAQLVLGMDDAVVGNEKERLERFVRDTHEIAIRKTLLKGGTHEQAISAAREAEAYAAKFKFDVEWQRGMKDIDARFRTGKISEEQYADLSQKKIEEYLKRRKVEQMQGGAQPETIVKRLRVAKGKSGKESRSRMLSFLTGEAKKFGGSIPENILNVIEDAAMSAEQKGLFSFFRFKKEFDKLGITYMNEVNTYNYARKMSGLDEMGNPRILTKQEIEVAAAQKEKDLAELKKRMDKEGSLTFVVEPK